MPRRNRRVDVPIYLPRPLNPQQLDQLAWFAHEHIDSHEAMLQEVGPANHARAATFSEDPVTRSRFASVGLALDERAKRLTGRDLSDVTPKLVG